MNKLQYDGPVVLAILDGVGLAVDGPGNAVARARTLFLEKAAREYPHVALDASGEAVGLTPGQMGNSEVGHNTIGAGQIIKQGLARVDEALGTGEAFKTEAWKGAISRAKNSGTLHFSGIFSDGGVHSSIDHLEKMVEQAYRDGVRRMRLHAVFDGRDVLPQSEPKFIRRFEKFAKQFNDADIRIASGGGRMVCVSDRYESDWDMVKRGFDMMVYGRADHYFKNAEEAIIELRAENPEVQDQNLPPFVIVEENGEPVGKVLPGDALIYFDFRADRAIEIAQAFIYRDFPYFDRGNYSPDDIFFVGMTEYNSDTHVPEHRLVEPVEIHNTLNQFLAEHGVSQFACSETVKFGHVTYYFNGNSYERAKGEKFYEVESYDGALEERPWMRTAEVTDKIIEEMPNYKFLRLNFPGGDMVGHTADLVATTMAVEAVDLSLRRIADKVRELKGVLIIIADHGNAEEVLTREGNKKTSHTTNPVPFILYDATENREKYEIRGGKKYGLSNVAATIATLFGLENYPEEWQESIIRIK
ncbi:MAG: 2,3-bisphosphoglycerate-independent phosphoglycerate mutase [Candidatus Saccharibacteria bacterium]|nr:2,3-bisphosphoglycerate-independent phosphoglycerate mutase [Candidatus Saccharibacteria bacterium]